MQSIPRPNYRILKDEEKNDFLITNGWVVLPLLDDEEVEFFRALYKKWHPTDPVNFYKSYFHPDPNYKIEVENLIEEKFTPRLKEYFTDYVPCGAMFVVKPQGEEGEIPPHQDWSFVDEKKHWSLNIWCPLVDTRGDNGNIQMLTGSHFFMDSIRGSGTPDLYEHLYQDIRPELTDVPMKAGDAVFFYHNIVHCSTPNNKPEARVSLGMSLIQKDAPIYYYYLEPGKERATKYLTDTDFYINYVSYREQMPDTAKNIGEAHMGFPVLSREELMEKICEVRQRTAVNV